MRVEETTKFICELRFKQPGKDLWISVCEYVDNLKNNSEWKCMIQRSWKIKITTNNGISSSSKDSESDECGNGITEAAKLRDSGCTCMWLLVQQWPSYFMKIMWKFITTHNGKHTSGHFSFISRTSGRQKIKVYATTVQVTNPYPSICTYRRPKNIVTNIFPDLCNTFWALLHHYISTVTCHFVAKPY